MIKKILLLSLIFCSLSVFAQKELDKGFVVLESNDTIVGKLKNKNYYSKGGVKLYQGDSKIGYSKKVLLEIHVDNDVYIKSDLDIWFQGFFKKEISGDVNLYSYKKTKRLGGFDSDIGSGRLIPAIRFYCSDYPNLTDSIKKVDKEHIGKFVKNYNDWKLQNPDSKSFYEVNMHNKPRFNFKLSFLLPGAGIEIGLNDKVSISTMLKNEFGYGNSIGWIINPFMDTQLRYYHNIDKRKAEKKRTYKYSGNYICLMNGYFLDAKANLIGIEYGWQRMVNRHWYYNLGVGAGKYTTGNQSFAILYDFDFGYNF
jgi:hypothetical protein